MKKVATDYKGKHFIITDENLVDGYDIVIPYIDIERLILGSLESHVSQCLYYGIPAYVGEDESLKEKIEIIYQNLEKES